MISGCTECGAPLAADQRYCLQCGVRHGAPRVDPLAALGFAALDPPAVSAAPAPPSAGPSRRLAAGLAAATLVLGAVVGAALGPGRTPSPAAAPQRLVALVTPAAAPAALPTTPAAPAAPAVDETPTTPATGAAGAVAAGTTAGTDTSSSSGSSPDHSTSPVPSPSSGSDATPAATAPPPAAAPHIWIVTLTALDARTAFGPASPLADLVAQGTLLRGYRPAAPTAAANGLALLGGQVPTADCAADLAACMPPASEPSLPAQIVGAGQRWRAYVEDPAARAAGPNARVPVSLFHGLADRSDYAAGIVGIDALNADLAAGDTTPELSLLVPAAAGLDAAPAVHDLVARITASPAYKDNGLLLVVVDAPPPPTDPAAPPPAVGLLVLSPRAAAGRALDSPTGPVALLRSLEDLLTLPPLGAAAQAPAGALADILAPAAAASAASVFPHPRTSTTTRRSS